MKKAFVLSGGSIKGAFQAGAMADLLTSGIFEPDLIYGTSVGSLNGAFIADRAGRAVKENKKPNWPDIGDELQKFWLKNIDTFDKIGKKRSKLSLYWSLLRGKFDSLLDMTRLYELIKREIKVDNLKKSTAKFYACTVNTETGEAIYASADKYENIHDYIIGSTAIPVVMPFRIINDNPFTDGGIREVAPLRKAIDDGAIEIKCIVCQTENLEEKDYNCKKITEIMDRLMGIVTNEIVRNDVNHCKEINEILEKTNGKIQTGPLKDKCKIDLSIIRPYEPIELKLDEFNREQIKNALKAGWTASQKARNAI